MEGLRQTSYGTQPASGLFGPAMSSAKMRVACIVHGGAGHTPGCVQEDTLSSRTADALMHWRKTQQGFLAMVDISHDFNRETRVTAIRAGGWSSTEIGTGPSHRTGAQPAKATGVKGTTIPAAIVGVTRESAAETSIDPFRVVESHEPTRLALDVVVAGHAVVHGFIRRYVTEDEERGGSAKRPRCMVPSAQSGDLLFYDTASRAFVASPESLGRRLLRYIPVGQVISAGAAHDILATETGSDLRSYRVSIGGQDVESHTARLRYIDVLRPELEDTVKLIGEVRDSAGMSNVIKVIEKFKSRVGSLIWSDMGGPQLASSGGSNGFGPALGRFVDELHARFGIDTPLTRELARDISKEESIQGEMRAPVEGGDGRTGQVEGGDGKTGQVEGGDGKSDQGAGEGNGTTINSAGPSKTVRKRTGRRTATQGTTRRRTATRNDVTPGTVTPDASKTRGETGIERAKETRATEDAKQALAMFHAKEAVEGFQRREATGKKGSNADPGE